MSEQDEGEQRVAGGMKTQAWTLGFKKSSTVVYSQNKSGVSTAKGEGKKTFFS